MINKYPLWKYALLIVVIVAGALFALPNLYGNDPAVQVSPRRGDISIGLRDDALKLLETNNIEVKSADVEDNRLTVRFANEEDQLIGRDLMAEAFVDNTIALNLVPATPEWLRDIAKPMYLGLDLRGGVHFLMEIDMDTALQQTEEGYIDSFRNYLRGQDIRYRGAKQVDGGVAVRFSETQLRDRAVAALGSQFPELELEPYEEDESFFILASLSEEALEEERRSALQQNLVTLRNRVNELGVSEPIIQQQGRERIVVQLPGVQDTTQAKEILGATATLEYRMVHGTAADWFTAEETGRIPPNAKMYRNREDGGPVLLQRRVIVTGDQIKGASSGIDTQSGSPAVFINLDGPGARRMQEVSSENIGNLMAVVFIENQVTTTRDDNGEIVRTKERVEEVINMATIRDVLSHRFQTTGLDTEEARTLALLLRAGALKAPIEIVEERTIGPSLGRDNIEAGMKSVLIGMTLVLIFMALYYKVFGLIADVALVVNLALIVAVLSSLQATLTLPGIAGIVLTVGMAVDANVLIFERIKEELRNGNSVQAAIDSGYEKAFVTIADANITTLIAAVVLFVFGTGPIKGFAITLSIGIVTSMFTAIVGTRAVVNLLYGGRRLQSLPI
jgi:preprotein translocase subunit SecD